MVATAFVATVLLGFTGCGNMSTRDKDTAIGAVVGGVAGDVLVGGTAGTVGGAVVGGVIGNQVGKDKKSNGRINRAVLRIESADIKQSISKGACGLLICKNFNCCSFVQDYISQ